MFDVGETLIDEMSSWRAFADHVGVPVQRVVGELERAAAEGRHHREALETAAGRPLVSGEFTYVPGPDDLYPDAMPALRRLQEAGYVIGIVGNQPEAIEPFLRGLGAELALVGSSQRWGVEKPNPSFFERITRELRLPATQIVYVGDRVDNDILPAARVGMRTALVARGPWGRVHSSWPEARTATVVVESLDDLL